MADASPSENASRIIGASPAIESDALPLAASGLHRRLAHFGSADGRMEAENRWPWELRIIDVKSKHLAPCSPRLPTRSECS